MDRRGKITVESLRSLKQGGGRFSVLTCYDAPTARLMQDAGVDVLLVGDTAAEVVLGLPTTRDIPVDFLLTLTAAVRRGAPDTLVMGDLPYGCRGSAEKTASGALQFLDAGADVVKIEVTPDDAGLVEAMTRAGVPVVAHLGLLPQMLGPDEGYTARGRTAEEARRLIADAKRFEAAGAVMLLLEAVASEVAREIVAHTELPVIGCVAGPHCDGTVVVLHDMIGWGGGHPPRTVRRYGDLAEFMTDAFRRYAEDVRSGSFPGHKESIHMRPGEFEALVALQAQAPHSP
jgi:3-methyl-2-oxobutanoate hydroxymethyltransferase